jgi:prolyl 4-hydroxylase
MGTMLSTASFSSVSERLRSLAGVQQVPSRQLELFVHRGFLEPDACSRLCVLIDEKRRPSEITDDIGVPDFRTSETCDLDRALELVASVDAKICALLGLEQKLGERIQGQRYASGQEFRPHTDTFEPGGVAYFENCADAGQRTWTAMVYLNVPAAGGATRFKRIDKTVHPETGKLLAWNNLLPSGEPNPATLHQGMKVRRGNKYVLTKWFRQRPVE